MIGNLLIQFSCNTDCVLTFLKTTYLRSNKWRCKHDVRTAICEILYVIARQSKGKKELLNETHWGAIEIRYPFFAKNFPPKEFLRTHSKSDMDGELN